MAGLSLGGLASGMDTDAVVSQLMQLERQPVVRLDQKKIKAQARKDQLNEVLSKLKELKTAAADLKSVATWTPGQKVEVNDPTKVAVERTGNAGIGGYQLEINRLAVAEQWSFTYTKDTGSDTTVDVDGVSITIAAGSEIDAAVDAINSKTDSPVYAVNSGGKLVLSARTTGAASDFVATGSTLSAGARTKAGAPAEYRIDGAPVAPAWSTSETNVLETAIPGLKLTLKAVTSSALTVNVGAPEADSNAIKDKIKRFTDVYNQTVDLVRKKLDEEKIREPEIIGDLKKGVLKGDTMLSGVLSRLRTELMNPTAGSDLDLDELSEIGITTGTAAGTGTFSTESVKGKLVLDETKLLEKLAGRSSDVRRLLAGEGADKGFSTRIDELLEPITGLDGDIESRIESTDSELERIADQISNMELRLADREKRLRATFTAMEQALANSQSQGNWLGAQLATLNR